jgi:hypothetical protein
MTPDAKVRVFDDSGTVEKHVESLVVVDPFVNRCRLHPAAIRWAGLREYQCGPDRRPGRGPGIITGATGLPERDADASTNLQTRPGSGQVKEFVMKAKVVKDAPSSAAPSAGSAARPGTATASR